MKDIALSTSDNPYNPLTHFDQWQEFDEKEKGYFTCSYLARIALISDDFSDELNAELIENAIDEIIKQNIIGIVTENKVKYIKVEG